VPSDGRAPAGLVARGVRKRGARPAARGAGTVRRHGRHLARWSAARRGRDARRTLMEIAVVTGTSTGIGFATSLRLARRVYRVFAGMRNLAKGDPLRAAAAEAELPVEVIPLDVTSSASVCHAFETVSGHGPVDVLVNNAGIGGASPLELTPDDEHR